MADHPADADDFADLLGAYDELLAAGAAPTLTFDTTVPDEVRVRVRRSAACVDLLRAAFARPKPTAAGPDMRVGRFEIRRELGRGAHGVVFLAYDPKLCREVALKVPRPEALVSPELRERFLHEARAAAGLDHPNIVPVHEVDQAGAVCYLAAAYVPGAPLTAWLADQQKAFDPVAAARLFATLARAVHHAHERGVVHRDLKPANILLAVSDEQSAVSPAPDRLTADRSSLTAVPKVTDFGLAKLLGPDAPSGPGTRTGAILGTPEYMAPEQARGRTVGPAADVYSLGAMLYEALAGQPPFRAATVIDLLEMVRSRDPVPPSRLRARVPRALETICLKCLRKDPADRYASARDLADDLDRFARGEPVRARPTGPARRAIQWARRNPAAAGLVVALAALIAVFIIGLPLALLLRAERNDARASRDRAEQAEVELRRQEDELRARSHLAAARAWRQGGRVGRRFECLTEVGRAAALDVPADLRHELRNEAVAALALPDLRPARDLGEWPTTRPVLAFDAAFERWAYCRTLTGDITVRAIADGRELVALPGPGNHAWVLRFSPDGRFLAAVYADTCAVRVWDLRRATATVAWPGSTAGVGFSPDGRRVAITRFGGGVTVYEAETGRAVGELPLVHDPIAFDPTGRTLAVGNGTALELRDLQSGRLIRSLAHPERKLRAVCWRPDGRLLAVGCGLEVFVWDAVTGALLQTLKGHDAEVTDLAFDPSGRLLASTGWDETMRFWDPVAGTALFTLPGSAAAPHFSRDGRRFGATRRGHELTLWEVADGRECRPLYAHAEAGKGEGLAAFHPDGRHLATGHSDGTRLWDLDTGRELSVLPTGWTTAALWPGADRLLVRGRDGLDEWAVRFGPGGPVSSRGRRLLTGGPAGGAPTAALTPDGRTVAVADRGADRVVLLDLAAAGGPAERLLGNFASVNQVAISPDGRWVAGATHFNSPIDIATVADARTGERVWSSHPHRARNAAFSPDGRWLATGGGGACRLWEVGTWNLAREIHSAGEPEVAGPVAFAPDGSTLAVAYPSGAVRLVDPATGDEQAALPIPGGRQATSLAFSPDGGRLAVYSTHVTHVWDLRAVRARLTDLGLDW